MAVEVFGAEQIEAANRRLAEASPQKILRWAVDTFYPSLTMATAFGAEGCCIIHMLAEIEPNVRIFNLETGYQFKETLVLRERIKEREGEAALANLDPERLMRPSSVAEAYWQIYREPRDAWSFEREIRPFAEKW